MFTSALKSFTSSITSNYSIDAQPFSNSGPWAIYNAKQKSSGKAASVFIFEVKSLNPPGAHLGGRAGAASNKALHQEVIERLRNEASALARLRHPSILELAEPVEETRGGGLIFVTEPILAPLSKLLESKASTSTTRQSPTHDSSEYDLNELEIQKGLLQLGKGLEFLHESAGLVHANLYPGSVYVTAKSDWKIAGFGFAGPASDSTKPTSLPAISLSQILRHDPRLPSTVQLNLDFASPDFVLDNNVKSSSDMFSLGLLILSLYAPFKSPIETHGSVAAYKRIFSAPSTVPRQANNFLTSGTLPPQLVSDVLPRLITRHPHNRLNAVAFQQVDYFNSVLVSSIRFLDALQGKVYAEKTQFLQGLPQIVPQIPKSVLSRKVMPVLLEQLKHPDVLNALLQCIFATMKQLSSGEAAKSDQVAAQLRQVFTAPSSDKAMSEDKKAALKIVMDNMPVLASVTKDTAFRDDILPIAALALRSMIPQLVDAALSTLPSMLTKLDYSTLKNTLFPLVAAVFAQTKSLSIKIRALEAFYLLCGGSDDTNGFVGDGLDGVVVQRAEKKSTSALDKFMVQDKLVPLVKAIKTKEPDVMMAALKVLKQVARIADFDFVAFEVLPILWTFALGPLLDLAQFQAYMDLIKAVSTKIEREQTQKLRDTSNAASSRQAVRAPVHTDVTAGRATSEQSFANLVTGRNAGSSSDMISDWDVSPINARSQAVVPGGSSMTSPPGGSLSRNTSAGLLSTVALRPTDSRPITPDQGLSAFATLQPQSMFNHPLQPTPMGSAPVANSSVGMQPSRAAHAPLQPLKPQSGASFAIAPPPQNTRTNMNGSGMSSMLAPGLSPGLSSAKTATSPNSVQRPPSGGQKSGLDKFESLI